jgi:ribonuclease-3
LLRQATPLERALGLRFRSAALRVAALTHRSYAFEQGSAETNERLEFLGDAVLGLVITDLAYRKFPELPEGELAKLRASIVNMSTLADVARELRLGSSIYLGKGEELSGGRDKPSILADAMEAVLGALYLDRGMEGVRRVIERLFWPRMLTYAGGGGDRDYKTGLQELVAQEMGAIPQYKITEEGPDHAKRFTAAVHVGGQLYGTGRGRSKKEAEQQAARVAFEQLVRVGRNVVAGEK